MSTAFHAAINTAEKLLISKIPELFGLEGYSFSQIPPHDGGRNLVYTCKKAGEKEKMLRIAFLSDRKKEDFLSELEYVRYLYDHGGSVSNVVDSQKGI